MPPVQHWQRLGVISGFDLTVEAALAKMAYLFSRNLRPEEVKNKMQIDMRGELSRPVGDDELGLYQG